MTLTIFWIQQLRGTPVVGLQLAHLRISLRDLQGGAVAIDADQRLAGADLLADVGMYTCSAMPEVFATTCDSARASSGAVPA